VGTDEDGPKSKPGERVFEGAKASWVGGTSDAAVGLAFFVFLAGLVLKGRVRGADAASSEEADTSGAEELEGVPSGAPELRTAFAVALLRRAGTEDIATIHHVSKRS
jgi:hypothetical protein